jgi:hypothetical protein
MMRMIKSTMVVLAACWLFTGVGPIYAQEENPDRFKISLSSYTLARYESEMALMERNTRTGISIWTFHHSDKVELAAGLGLHVTKIAMGLEAETTSSGVDAKNVSVTAPLPVLSFSLRYNVTPKLG